MTKRGRKLAPWTKEFLNLKEDFEYSFEDLEVVLSKKKYEIEGQVRRLNIKPIYYLQIKKTTRRAFFLGKDIISHYKKRVYLEKNYYKSEIFSCKKTLNKGEHSLEKKLDLFLITESKINPELKTELDIIDQIEYEVNKNINEIYKTKT
ncbi:hypothetical protein GCL60_16505 [Silvanigrella paludirubra]|uniref:Uncharacterized protein n=1 Tax=Silvanigrella paludirubra TaxID=2499159 RepID=A0A6N6VQ99_9BACT|nr:hypothetical protein [Silvanigrella paludirubra]KAB8035830.1 hypothetical protein GCL60_16505 [Silvanigrella paludirubra]